MTDVRRLYVLLCGFEILRKSISTHNLGHRFVMSEPISAYLLDTAQGWILMDAGFDPAHIAGPQDVQAFFDRTGCYPPVVGAEHRIEAQLAQIGVAPQDIAQVILSHMHNDHTGFLKRLPHARISVQKRELDYARLPGIPGCYTPADYQGLDLDWDVVSGDWQVMPGLQMLSTRGHTEGHQSAVIHLPSTGPVVLPFDAGDLQENFDREILPGAVCDEADARASILRLKQVAQALSARMMLFHDPVMIQALRLAPHFYD